MKGIRVLLALLLAVLVTAVLGSIVQTQFNLAALIALEVPIPPDVRLRTTARDLVGFGPAMAAVTGAGFVVAFAVAGLLARLAPQWRTALFMLAGGGAMLSALLIMASVLPITPIAAARTWPGVVALSLTGVVGGWVFQRMLSGRPSPE